MRRLYIDGESPYGEAYPMHSTASLVLEEEQIANELGKA